MSYKVEIVESSSKLVELESSIGDQQPTIEVLKENETSIVITQDVAILPSDFNDDVKSIVSSFLNEGYGISITPSGSFLIISTSGLQPSGNYSLVGHDHTSSDITDFNSSVSGLLPVKNIISGSGINVLDVSGIFTVAVTGQFGLTSEQVDDRVSNLLSSGYGINLSYDDNNNLLTISTIGLQPSGNYSIIGHSHLSSDITDFILSASGAAPVQTVAGRIGNVVLSKSDVGLNNVDNTSDLNKPISNAVQSGLDTKANSVHSHSSSEITDFSSSVSGLLPVKNILSGNGISVTSSGSDFTVAATGQFGLTSEQVDDRVSNLLVAGNYVNLNYNDLSDILTVSVTGVQPSGNYANSVHSHTSSDITDFNSAVSGLLPVKDIVAGTGIAVTSSSGLYTINSTVNEVAQAVSLVTTVFNKTGSPISKMSAVYVNGGQGDMPTVTLAIATSDMTSAGTYGLAYETINNMSSGKVIVFGVLTGLNTDQFNPTAPTGDVNGTVLYLSPTTSGLITKTKPSAPDHIVAIGTIVRTHQNEGIIEVRIQNGFELEELHNVAISGVTNGQFLQYNSISQLWIPSSSGNFSTLQVNGTGVSVSGHTHTVSHITNFASGVADTLSTTLVAGQSIAFDYNPSLDTLTIGSNGLVSVLSLGTLTGTNAINAGVNNSIQTLTLNGTAVTFTKGSNWPATSTTSTDTVLKITVSSPTTITWTIVTDWFNQPSAGALAVGTHLFLLRGVGTTVVEGHYIGAKTN